MSTSYGEEPNLLASLNKDLCQKIRDAKKILTSNYSDELKKEFVTMAKVLYDEIYRLRNSDIFIGKLHHYIGELFPESDYVAETNVISNIDKSEEFYCGYIDDQGNQHQFVGFWDKVVDDEGNEVLEPVMYLRLVIPFNKFLRWLESTEDI